MGAVVELLGRRRGQMIDMQGVGYVLCSLLHLHFNECILSNFGNILVMAYNSNFKVQVHGFVSISNEFYDAKINL